jgi:hypothetical protein
MNPIKAFLNHHYHEDFNASHCLTALRFLSTNKLINNEILAVIPEVFSKIVESGFQTRQVYKDIVNDELPNFVKDYKFTHIPLDQFSLSKYLVLYFDNEGLLDWIFSVTNRKALLEHLTNNITAYYHFYGSLPKAFSSEIVKRQYQKARDHIKDNDTELEFFLTLFKYNKINDYSADVLNIWRSKNLEALHFNVADFILNSRLKAGGHYHKEIAKVFNNDGQDRNGSKLVQNTLAYLKDGNEAHAISNFLESFEKRVSMLKDNDGQLLNLLLQTEGQEIYDPDREMKYTLARVKIMDKIKNDLRILFNNIKEQSKNSFQANEKIAKYISNGFTSGTPGSYTDELLSGIKDSLKDLKAIRYEDFTAEIVEDSIEDIENRLKVLVYLDKRRYRMLFTTLGRDIQAFDELKMIEIDFQERDSILKKIRTDRGKHSGEDGKFIDLLKRYVERKAEDVRKVIIDETVMRDLDNSILQGTNDTDLVSRAKQYAIGMKNKHHRTRGSNDPNNIEYIEKNLGFDPLKPNASSKEEKLKIYKSSLVKYRKLLNDACKKECQELKLFKGLNVTLYPQHFNNRMKQYIFNHIGYQDRLVNFVLKRLRTQVFYYPQRLRGYNKSQQRSIILGGLNKYKSDLANYIKTNLNLPYVPKNNSLNTLYHKLQAIEADLINKKDEEVFIENLFKQMCATQGIVIDTTPKAVKSRQDQLTNLKNILGQDHTVLDYKNAIYMITYGVEHKLPLGKQFI